MRPNLWLTAFLLLFIFVETLGIVWKYPVAGAAAVYSFFFTVLFFLFFFAIYLGCFLRLEGNPWVRRVKDMRWNPFNPLFFTWLFENDRRRWALYVTIISSVYSLLFGTIFFYLFMRAEVTVEDSSIGFLIGFSLLIFLAVSWYRGFWKPRTREKKIKSIALEEKFEFEEEERYYPPKPA